MTIYTLRSSASSGRIVAVQRFSAEDDKEARAMASDIVKGAAAVARFDLWQGERRIAGAGAQDEGSALRARDRG